MCHCSVKCFVLQHEIYCTEGEEHSYCVLNSLIAYTNIHTHIHNHIHIFPLQGGRTVPDHDFSFSCGYLPPGNHQSVLEGHGSRSLTVEIFSAQGHAILAVHWSCYHAPTGVVGCTTNQWRWEPGWQTRRGGQRTGNEMWLYVRVGIMCFLLSCIKVRWRILVEWLSIIILIPTDTWKAARPAGNSGFLHGQRTRWWLRFFSLWCPHLNHAMPCLDLAWSIWMSL